MTFAKLGGRERCKSEPWPRKSAGRSEFYDDHRRGTRTEDSEAGHAATCPGSAIHRLRHVGKTIYVSEDTAFVKMKTITSPIIKKHFSDIRYSLPLFYFSL